MANNPTIQAAALRSIREEFFPLARDAANAAGFSGSYLSGLETGKRPLTKLAIKKLAEAFNIKPNELERRLDLEAARISAEPDVPVFPNRAGFSQRLHEALPHYGRSVKTETLAADDLLRHLVEKMSREEKFDLLRQFTEQAASGDASALGKAAKLIQLIAGADPPLVKSP